MADGSYVRLPIDEDDEMLLNGNRGFARRCLYIMCYNGCVRRVMKLWEKFDPDTNRNDRGYGRNGDVEMPRNRHYCCPVWFCFSCIRNIACCCLTIVFYNCCIRCVTNLWKKYDPDTKRSDGNDRSSNEVRISIEDESRLDETKKQLQEEKDKNARLCSSLESMGFDLKESKERIDDQMKQLIKEQEKTNDFRSRASYGIEGEKEGSLFNMHWRRRKFSQNQMNNDPFGDKRRKEMFLEQKSKQLEVEKNEKEKALTRLSAVAGDKLRLNNPGIADLSDENRPNKLAEKFSELYDNEWTELYDELESREKKAEPDIVEEMFNLLKNIYQHASEMAEKQRKTLVTIISKPSTTELDEFENPPDQILSKVIELQKQTVSMSIGNLKQIIAVKIHAEEMSEVKKKYYDRCVQLCWIMAIQDPPMMLDFGEGKGMPVNTDVFRMFTKQGTTTDFVVWPAVYLHENGPLVQKGVLQPE